MSLWLWLACLSSGLAAAAATRLVVPPAARLGPRIRPYTLAARSRLGAPLRPGDLAVDPRLPAPAGARLPTVIEAAARWLGGVLDGLSDEALERRLRQADLFPALPPDAKLREYRARQLGLTVLGTGLGAGAGLVLGGGPLALLGAAAGLAFGATRWRARLDRAIEARRLQLQIELYTVNHLLAMTVRTGGGVGQALTRVAERGQGGLVTEVRDLLAAHRGGRPLDDALEQAAALTCEPHAARTFRLLAGGVRYGTDLATGLRALSTDLREQRADALRRTATKRRAAMLVPIIAVLAPVMLLFVAAPLPTIVFGGP